MAAPNLIHLPDALAQLEDLVASIRLKNTTMINYYIHPQPTPTAIAAFEPRIDALAKRIAHLASLSIPHLCILLDHAQSWVASYMLPPTEQLAIAIYGFQRLFIEHYDRTLEQKLPYLNMYQTLRHIEEQLKHFVAFHSQDPRRRSAAQLLAPPSPTKAGLCVAAVAFTNGADQGQISQCPYDELASENRSKLLRDGGVFLWWECPSCAFRLRFHVSNSAAMNINTTQEVRRLGGLGQIEMRSSWLAKCHVYHPNREVQVQARVRRRSNSFSQSRRSRPRSISNNGVGGVKYGCLFCFAHGASFEAGTSAFATANELAEHLARRHVDTLPQSLLLQKLKVAVNGQTAQGVSRWDLNLTG